MNVDTLTDRLNQTFSRQVLGAFLLAAATGKLIEKSIILLALGWNLDVALVMVGWGVAWVITIVLYLYWDWAEGLVHKVRKLVLPI